MTEGDENEEGAPRRVDVELFIRHPTMKPAEITAALGIEPLIVHGVGEPRRAPDGKQLGGAYQVTAWRHSVCYKLTEQRFADKVTLLVDLLLPHKSFLTGLRATGGETSIIVQFLGDGYLGDNVPVDTLVKMADLQLDFGIECFTVPQFEGLHRRVH